MGAKFTSERPDSCSEGALKRISSDLRPTGNAMKSEHVRHWPWADVFLIMVGETGKSRKTTLEQPGPGSKLRCPSASRHQTWPTDPVTPTTRKARIVIHALYSDFSAHLIKAFMAYPVFNLVRQLLRDKVPLVFSWNRLPKRADAQENSSDRFQDNRNLIGLGR